MQVTTGMHNIRAAQRENNTSPASRQGGRATLGVCDLTCKFIDSLQNKRREGLLGMEAGEGRAH